MVREDCDSDLGRKGGHDTLEQYKRVISPDEIVTKYAA
jgi:hypothetical protein